MASHKARAHFDRARWRLAILVPSWVLQLALSISLVVLFACRLATTNISKHDQQYAWTLFWMVGSIGLSVVAAACTIFEIVRYMAELLTPWTMIFTQIAKLACVSILLVVDIFAYLQHHGDQFSVVGFAIDGLSIVTIVAIASYSAFACYQISSYDEYAHPANVKFFGFKNGLDPGDSAPQRLSLASSFDRRLSWRRSSGFSSGSANNTGLPLQFEQAIQTPGSYTHERDTHFDDYMARRWSSSAKSDAERAMASEFGWSDSLGHAGDHEEREWMIMGAVNTRLRDSTAPRAPSWTSEHGLISVPEEDEDVADRDSSHGSQKEGLLGDGKSDITSAKDPSYQRAGRAKDDGDDYASVVHTTISPDGTEEL